MNFYVSLLDENKSIDYKIQNNRQVYFIQISGTSSVNGIELSDGDAMEIVDEKNLNIKAINNSHFLFIEMNKA